MFPYENFGGSGQPLHFLHANGYPPAAYRPLLEMLSSKYTVLAMRMRPLWPEENSKNLKDWLLLADDLEDFLMEQAADKVGGNFSAPVGVGHSMGATITLRLALKRPDLFRTIVLIDPVLFPPSLTLFINVLSGLGLLDQIHPLVRSTLRRRNFYAKRQAMFDSYRKKPVFSRLPESSLWAYVDSLACDLPDGGVRLCFSPQWEARIYATGGLRDMSLWHDLPSLHMPVLLLRGELSNTFWASTARLFQRKLPEAQIIALPNTTHLLPLEQPENAFHIIDKFLSGKVTNDT